MILFPMKGDTNVRLIGDVNRDQENNPDLTWENVHKDILSRLKLNVEKVNWFSSYRVHHRVASQFRRKMFFIRRRCTYSQSGRWSGYEYGHRRMPSIWPGNWRPLSTDNPTKNLLDTYETERIPLREN